MNTIKGKGLAIGGTVVSTVFSFFGILFGLIFKWAMTTPDYVDSFVEGAMSQDPTLTRDDALLLAEETSSGFEIFSNIAIYAGIVFLIIGIVGFILSLIVNHKNKKAIGITLIIFAVLHFFSLRLLAFVLILIGGIQITMSEDPADPDEEIKEDEPESSLFDESELV